MRRLLGGLLGARRFGIFAAAAAVVAVNTAAAAVLARDYDIPASQIPCPAAEAPARRVETRTGAGTGFHRRRLGSGGSCCRERVSRRVLSSVEHFACASSVLVCGQVCILLVRRPFGELGLIQFVGGCCAFVAGSLVSPSFAEFEWSLAPQEAANGTY